MGKRGVQVPGKGAGKHKRKFQVRERKGQKGQGQGRMQNKRAVKHQVLYLFGQGRGTLGGERKPRNKKGGREGHVEKQKRRHAWKGRGKIMSMES